MFFHMFLYVFTHVLGHFASKCEVVSIGFNAVEELVVTASLDCSARTRFGLGLGVATGSGSSLRAGW